MGTLSALIVIAMLAVALCFTPDEWQATSDHWGSTTEDKKTHVLDRVPLVVGNNWLPDYIQRIEDNKLKNFNFDSDLTKNPKWNSSVCHTDLPRLRKGKVGAQFWAFDPPSDHVLENTLEKIDVIKRLTTKYPNDMQFVDSADGIEAAFSAGKIGSLINLKGGHTIDSRLAVLRMYYELGVRCMMLTHTTSTPWAGVYGEATGLTSFGRHVVREMNRLGMIVDVTDASHETMRDAIKNSQTPVIFSSSAAAALCNHSFNIPDDILDMVNKKGGLVMVGFVSGFIRCDGTLATLDDVVDHINYIKNLAGVDHVGIGGEYNGYKHMPKGLEDVSHFPDLFDKLANNSDPVVTWTDEDLKKLAGLNLLRVFREVERGFRRDGEEVASSTPGH